LITCKCSQNHDQEPSHKLTFDILSKIEVVLPKETALVDAFTEKILQPSFEKQLKNDVETETLSKLRDTLLPKLISGELRSFKAENLVEVAK
jgi:type I restriction enzyme S subunit